MHFLPMDVANFEAYKIFHMFSELLPTILKKMWQNGPTDKDQILMILRL